MHSRFRVVILHMLLLFLLTVGSVVAQREDRGKTPPRFDRAAVEKRANELRIPVTMSNETTKAVLVGFRDNGAPLYYSTSNSVSASTISTSAVYPGGTAGLSLTGAGVTLGEWDGGGVLTTHQELTGRVTQMDTPSGLSDHATHVAGTLIASGVDAAARGMAYAATLQAYDWDNDSTEMKTAAGNGLLVSNHSYGFLTGWYFFSGSWYWFGDVSISTTEDADFGYYSERTWTWDNIGKTYPNYLIVKSAGNDRGQGPAPGTGHYYWNPATSSWTWSTATRDRDGGTLGYDCLTDMGNAKNILTVGAVNDIPGGYTNPAGVVMSSFSGWGPTDDGRIKPDIVTNGVGLYSSLIPNNNSYASFSGTSMASPSAAGSIGLLLEHQENLHPSVTLKSSTMKALVVHTADEAGTTTGPDYAFGWGLMNTAKAAKVMTDHAAPGSPGHIHEHLLANSTTYSRTVESDGTPLRVTVAWTDPAVQVLAPALNNRTPRLVNDLDMRVIGPGPTTYYPYRLDPDNPANAATTGDNMRDNVEMIHIPAPTSGAQYIVQVTHKGTLVGGSQLASIIVTGNVPMANSLPTADAGTDQTINCVPSTGVNVTLNGSGSSDPDNDPLTYTWRIGATVIAGPTSSSSSVVVLQPGVHVVTLTVDDGISGTDSDNVTITLNADVTPPGITAPADVILPNDPGLCSRALANVALGTPTTSDNCGVTSVTNNAPATFPVGTTIVTWTAMDAAGNSATANQRVTIQETEAPTITAPANVTQPNDINICGRSRTNTVLGTPTTADNCGVASFINNAPSTFPVGITTVTWTVTDASGNSAVATQTVTIQDTQQPNITAPAALVLSNDAGLCGKNLSSFSLGTPTVSDNCPGVTYYNNAPAFFPRGLTVVIWTALDAHGNTRTATQNVTINDTQPPTISTLSPVTANNDPNICGRARANTALGLPSASDNCGTVTITNNAPVTFPVGITIVTWTATDGSNNTATSTQSVTIIDAQPPTITAPAAVNLTNDPGQCGRAKTNVTMGNPVTSDNCGVTSVTNNAPNFFPVGTTVVTWTAQDARGNMATATQNIVIRDTEKPTIFAPSAVTVDANATVCGRSSAFALGTATASDNCTVVTVTNNAPSFYPVGTTTVTWTATDQYGNFNTATQQVTVRDVTPPVITPVLFPQYLFPADRTMRTITASITLNDNCPGSTFVLSSVTSNEPDAGTGPGDLPGDIAAVIGQPATQFALRAERAPMGFGRTYTVRYTAKDASNNQSIVTRYVYVAWNFLKEDEVVFSDEAVIPESPALEQNYPNPFSGSTSLVFRLPEEQSISLTVYDALGREVARLADGFFNRGSHAVIFEANDLPDGVYYARLVYGSQVIQTKMLLVRN
jgi:hypothetical protein